MIEFITHTAPEDITPSKNQEQNNGVLNNSCVGENISKDSTNPPHVEKHIGHDKIPEINSPKNLKGALGLSPHF
jgi:hypothetical protein